MTNSPNTLVPVTLNLIRQLFSLTSVFVLIKTPDDSLSVLSVDSASESAVSPGATLPRGPLTDWVLKNKKSLSFKLSERGFHHAGGLYVDSHCGVDGVMIIPCAMSDDRTALYWCDAAVGTVFSPEKLKYLEDYLAYVSPCLSVSREEPLIMRAAQEPAESLATYLPPDEFSRNAQKLVQGMGQGKSELVRFVPKNMTVLEEELGVVAFVNLYEQTLKRIAQIFPKGTPLLKLPDGAILAIVDAMLVGLYSNRIKSICSLTQAEGGKHFEFDSFKAGLRQASASGATVVQIIDQFNTNKAVVRDLLAANG